MSTCSTCRFGIESGPNMQDLTAPRAVECRRYPPMMALVQTGGGGMGTVSLACTVPPDYVCGEYAPAAAGVIQ